MKNKCLSFFWVSIFLGILLVVAAFLIVYSVVRVEDPDVEELFARSFATEFLESYTVKQNRKENHLLKMMLRRSDQYFIELSESDFDNLLSTVRDPSSWKPQPALGAPGAKGSIIEWERIYSFDEYGIFSIARVNLKIRVVTVSFYDER